MVSVAVVSVAVVSVAVVSVAVNSDLVDAIESVDITEFNAAKVSVVVSEFVAEFDAVVFDISSASCWVRVRVEVFVPVSLKVETEEPLDSVASATSLGIVDVVDADPDERIILVVHAGVIVVPWFS